MTISNKFSGTPDKGQVTSMLWVGCNFPAEQKGGVTMTITQIKARTRVKVRMTEEEARIVHDQLGKFISRLDTVKQSQQKD